jgi:phenylacetate-CoA ligase
VRQVARTRKGTSAPLAGEEAARRRLGRTPATPFSRVANTALIAAIGRREREIPYWPLARVELLQGERVRAVVRHAHATVPFYRSFIAEQGLEPDDFRSAADLARLPLLDGAELAADPMRFVSRPFERDGREVFNTSGSSSGLRKPVFWDHGSLLLRAARAERDRVVIARLAGEPWAHVIAREFLTNERRHTLARLVGVDTTAHQRLLILPADFSSRTQRTIYSERSSIPRRPVHYHHLPPTVPLEVAAAHVRAIRPRVVFSFGSYADQFFRYLEASDTPIPPPRVWVYLGDRLSAEGRRLAEQRGCLVYSVYGSMEAGTVGFQCEERDGFHLNVDVCSVRVVDDAGRDGPAGEPGEIVISPLDNRAIVLLNYRLGDRGALSTTPCPCGRSLPVLARLEGRRSELIRLADGRELSSLTLEALFGRELRRTIQAQIAEDEAGRLRWRIVPFDGVDRDALRTAVVARGREVLGADTSLAVEFLDGIDPTPAGKFVRAVGARPGP